MLQLCILGRQRKFERKVGFIESCLIFIIMNFKHVLSEMGVLKTFSIAKRVSDADIIVLTEKYNRLKKKNISLTDFMKRAIAKSMQDAFENQTVPGLIFADFVPTQEDHEKMIALTQFASLVSKKLVEKKLGKFYHCFVVNSIVNMLGLSDKDFDEFHRQFSKFEDEDGEDEE